MLRDVLAVHQRDDAVQAQGRIGRVVDLGDEAGDDTEAFEGVVFALDGDEELVRWDSAEWISDPSVTLTIANAIVIGFTEGPDAIRARLGVQS
jgi:hypothetical protein